jgi:two-component system NarL family sensor kinase
MKYFSFLLFLTLLTTFSFAQTARLDSMRRVVFAQPDTEQVKTLGWLSSGILRTYADSALYYGTLQHELGEKMGSRRWSIIGTSHMGTAYKYLGDYQKSLECEFAVLEYSRDVDNKASQGLCMMRIGNLYKRLGDYEKSEPFYLEAIELQQATGNKNFEGSAYLNYSTMLDETERYEESLAMDRKALKIYEELENTARINLCKSNIGSTLIELGRYAEARPLLLETLEFSRAEQDRVDVFTCLSNLGLIEENQQRFNQAISYYEEALQLAKDIPIPKQIQKMSHDLARALGEAGQYERALALERRAYFLQDSLYRVTKAEEVAELQAKFETAEKDLEISKKDEKIARKDLENTRLLSGLGIAALLLLVLSLSFLLYRQRQGRRMEAQLQLAQKEQFRAVLAAEENERRRIAGELHDGIGQLLSTTKLQLSTVKPESETQNPKLETAIGLLDDSVVEVRQISHKLAPPALLRGGLHKALRDLARLVRNTDKIAFSLDLDPQNPKPETRNPELETHLYRIIQELVNNSLKHAGCSEMGLSLKEVGGSIHIDFWDDGGGFDMSEVMAKGGGLGWQSILGRLKLLDGDVEVQSDVNEGTKVKLAVPSS